MPKINQRFSKTASNKSSAARQKYVTHSFSANFSILLQSLAKALSSSSSLVLGLGFFIVTGLEVVFALTVALCL